MRLLAVAESLTAQDGWAAYSLGLVRGLAELGVQTTVLTKREAEPASPRDVEVIPCLSGALIGLARPDVAARNALELRRHVKGRDLLHLMVEPYAPASLWPGLPPICITVHGTYAVAPFRQRRPTRWLYTAALRRARRVICVSHFTRDALLRQVDLPDADVIHNGHDLLPTNGRTDSFRVDGRPLILGVGALKARKGYHVALRAVARIKDRFPGLRYYLVGDDSDRAYVDGLRTDIAQLGLTEHAVITGRIGDDRLRALYQQADLFMLTPINVGASFEGFGIAYLEANAYGKPVIGSHGCGSAEAVEDGVNGLLAPQHDDAAIAERAAAILGDPALAARLGTAGRAKAERQTWANVARQYLEIYERILRGEGSASTPGVQR